MEPTLPTGETMSEGSPIPPKPDAIGEQIVPLKLLAQPDDSEQMQNPAEGDSGTMQVDFTVVRIEGDNAFIKPVAINGQPLEAEMEASTEPSEEDQEAALSQAMNSPAYEQAR